MTASEPWSRDELRHAVDIYASMYRRYLAGERYSIADHRESALEGLLAGRSARSFDIRMCSISHILESNGEDWLPEFVPLSHVRQNVEFEILDVLTEPASAASTEKGAAEHCVVGNESVATAERPSTGATTQLLPTDAADPTTLEDAASQGLARIPRGTRVAPAFDSRGVAALTRRMGLDGLPPCTLQEAGDHVGISRERVRQLQLLFSEWLENVEQTGSLNAAPAVVSQAIRVANHEPHKSPSEALASQRLSTGVWPFAAVRKLSLIYGLGDEIGLLEQDSPESNRRAMRAREIRSHCANATWRASGKSGFAYIAGILKEMNTLVAEVLQDQDPVAMDELQEHLDECDTIVALPQDFYYVVRRKSTVVGTTRRMLQVSQPLAISDVRSGLRRRFKFRKIPFHLTSEVLTAFFMQHEAFHVDDRGRVSSTAALDEPQDTVQMWIVNQLRSSDYGLLTRNQIIERGMKARKNASSVSIYLTYGEQIAHDRNGFFYPIGCRPSDDQVGEGLELAHATFRRTSQEWHYDDSQRRLKIWVQLGHTTIGSGVLWADNASRGVLELLADERYPLHDDEGGLHGSLWRSEAFDALGGLSTFLAHNYAEPGDHLVIEIDLDEVTATAQVGGSELVDTA